MVLVARVMAVITLLCGGLVAFAWAFDVLGGPFASGGWVLYPAEQEVPAPARLGRVAAEVAAPLSSVVSSVVLAVLLGLAARLAKR